MRIVLLHGWGLGSSVWHHLVKELAKDYPCQAIDLPGYGKRYNNSLRNYDLHHLSVWLKDQITEPSLICGWSLGAQLAWYFALHQPELVTGLINIAGTPCFLQKPHWPGMSDEELEAFKRNLDLDVNKQRQKFMQLQVFGCGSQHTVLDELIGIMKSEPVNHDALRCGLNILSDTDLRTEVAALQCQQLHILSDTDQITKISILENMKSWGEQHTFQVVNGAAHIPHMIQPKQVALAVHQFAMNIKEACYDF